jgi:hypothetical protein
MCCPTLAVQLTLRHDILKWILHRAGIAPALEPDLHSLPGLTAGEGTSAHGSAIRVGARGDVLLAMPQGISIADVSVIHPHLHQHPLSSCGNSRGSSLASGQPEADCLCQNGTEWLQLCTLLCEVMQAIGLTGDEALTFARR